MLGIYNLIRVVFFCSLYRNCMIFCKIVTVKICIENIKFYKKFYKNEKNLKLYFKEPAV